MRKRSFIDRGLARQGLARHVRVGYVSVGYGVVRSDKIRLGMSSLVAVCLVKAWSVCG